MSDQHSDALVFFGATGDLAYKKIFPALQAMIKRGHLNVPVVGVAKAGWNLDQLRARAQSSRSPVGEFPWTFLSRHRYSPTVRRRNIGFILLLSENRPCLFYSAKSHSMGRIALRWAHQKALRLDSPELLHRSKLRNQLR